LCQDAQRLEIADKRDHQRCSLRRASPIEKEEDHGGFVQCCTDIRSIVFCKLRTGAKMDTPQYINEVLSDVRCIKPGWYAMDDVGNLSSGPFSSHAECFGSIIQPVFGPLQTINKQKD
jgi:hypothetical protein